MERGGRKYWNDLRGNHDCFNVPGWSHSTNYFAKYGVRRDRPGFDFVHQTAFGRYHIVGIDAWYGCFACTCGIVS